MMTWQAKSLSWKERTHTSHRAFSDSAASTLREALPVELRKFVTGLTTHLNPLVRLSDLPGVVFAGQNSLGLRMALYRQPNTSDS
jgi:hypothetical protein